MSIKSTENVLPENLLACRTCLATERKLYSIYEWYLLEPIKFVLGNEVSPYDGLPQYVCNYCSTLLLKFNQFRTNCQRVQSYIEDVKILPPDLKPNYYKTLKISEIKIIDTTQEEHQLKIDENEINSFDSQNFDYNNDSLDNSSNDESEIFTFKIENTSKTNSKLIKKQTNLNKIETKLRNTDSNISQTDTKMTKSNSNISESDSKMTETDSNISYTDSKMTKTDLNISQTDSKMTKSISIERKKGKIFETDENLRDFERNYNVEVIILSAEQQIKDVQERKSSNNYLQSPYKCNFCYKGVMDEDSLKKHMLYQHDPSRGAIVCQFCSFRYKDKRGLNQHLKSHRLKFICKQCDYVSRTTFNAKEHFKMHTGYTHKCRHCGKSYEKLSSHLTHLRKHHPSDFIWCKICGEAFIGEFGLNAHRKRAHRHLNLPFNCTSCDSNFTTENALSRHSSYNNCSNTFCVHCGEHFEKTMELRDHLLEKHRCSKVYECEKCHKTFSRQSLHSAHYRRAHVDATHRQKPDTHWVCEICGKTLPNKSVLVYHQRNHTGVRPYQCTQCNKSFTMKKLLQSHLRVHTSDRPYICKLCPKAFKGLSGLRAHEHIHNGGQKKTCTNRKT